MIVSARNLWTGALACAAAGALLALSFVATPVKFLANGVPLEHLLLVGRVTFRGSLATELCLLVPLLIVASGRLRWFAGLAAMVLAVQWLLIMPALDARTLARIDGAMLPPSSLHIVWIVADAARVVVYLATAALALAPQRRWHTGVLVRAPFAPN